MPIGSAFAPLADGSFRAGPLTRGPWDPKHQHAGPPIALVCRAIEQAAAKHKLDHIARLTANLIRPVPIGVLSIDVSEDYIGRSVGHFSARLIGDGKEVGRFTAVAQREHDIVLPPDLPGHPLPQPPVSPEDSPAAEFPFDHSAVGYFDLVETRLARGRFFQAPSAVWFRLNHPLVAGEPPSVYQRVAVAADSGNGVSAVLDIRHYTFVNTDLTINLLRQPRGEWICLDARTLLGADGNGLAESALYDADGLIGRATQSLMVRAR